jgi:hypothetical protein
VKILDLTNIIVIKLRRMRQLRHEACMGQMKTLVRKAEGKRPLGRMRHTWNNNNNETRS